MLAGDEHAVAEPPPEHINVVRSLLKQETRAAIEMGCFPGLISGIVSAMGSALDNWNSDNRPVCFRQFAEELLTMAKETTARDGTHVPLVFVVTEDGEGSLNPIPPGVDQTQIVAALKDAVRQHPIYGIIRIHEGWAYYPQGPSDHTMKQIMEGEIAVSQLSPRDRGEALVVLMESREGADVLWTTPMLREGEKVRLGETTVFEAGFRGGLPRVFEDP